MLVRIKRFVRKIWLKDLLVYGQTWKSPLWSWDSKIGCISRINWLNELIFCMLIQVQEWRKLIQYFGGCGQKWVQPLSNCGSKIFFISTTNRWIDLILCMLYISVRLLILLCICNFWTTGFPCSWTCFIYCIEWLFYNFLKCHSNCFTFNLSKE